MHRSPCPTVAPRRALVEKVFGTLKRSYGYQRVRYRGLGHNTAPP